MKQLKYKQNISVHPLAGNHVRIFSAILLTLSLGIGSFLSNGCVAAPAVMLTSTAVTAAALVSEGERFVQYPDAGNSTFVQHDTGEESTCKQTCQLHEAPLEREGVSPDA